ncbi:hypothetical protein GCM10023321_42310 [Pseudonocardia eucalypti]|uniref:DUF4386 domain-containing protein n=1 Tax=Pseudonocardia eucalypti TaxID=648755 RepID=A0ABP9QDQ4_9PSEU|nr:hypothetical protein [Pseudonocardia eucalypti]
MNTRMMKLCSWSGVAAIVLIAGGFVLAGFVPPPPPGADAARIGELFREDANRIRFGMILGMYGASLLMLYAAVIAIQMRRIEGRNAVLALAQFGCGAIFVLEFIYLEFFWVAATFRAERADDSFLLLNDMAWIPFIGISSTVVIQSLLFGIVILRDSGARYFPRWLGYYNIWAALSFTPGTFNMFFKSGPLAWDGVLAFWFPVLVFVSWLIINPLFLAKSVDRASEAETGTDPTALAAELGELREKLARLTTKLGANA